MKHAADALPVQLAPGRLEAGVDEAGRGSVAGPLYTAAVILPEGFANPLVRDSKLLAPDKRNEARVLIQSEAIAWAVYRLEVADVDRLNVYQATMRGMIHALEQLAPQPEFVAVDGNRFPGYAGVPHRCIVKGDSLYAHIAAASILAKTHRDAEMVALHEQFPEYNWQENKGYGTPAHKAALRQYGLSPHHRRTFKKAYAGLGIPGY